MTLKADLIVLPLLSFIISTAIFLVMRGILFKFLKKWISLTPFKIDSIILKSLKMPSVFLCISAGMYVGLETSELSKRHYEIVQKIIVIFMTFSVSLTLANLTSGIFKNYFDRFQLPISSTALFFGVLKGTIVLIGLIIIMSILGISITPIITALGVGGLAVALALKDTLENLFAGLHILIEKTIRVGDFIRLENGNEGNVEDITWRTTRIKTVQNNMVIIPNSKLSQSIVLNYSLPNNDLSIQIPISVSYDSDIEKVEQILIEETNFLKTENDLLIKELEPVVRFNPGFGENSLDFTLICYIKDIKSQFAVIHDLRKNIFKRLKKEGIEIPYPQRVVHLNQMK